MKLLCDRCKKEFEYTDELYQSEYSNSQNDGQEILCTDCQEDLDDEF